MLSSVSASSFVAKRPSVQMTFGRMMPICSMRWGATGLDLVRSRVAVLGRPALHHVGDVDVGARQSDAAQQLVEQLAGLPHERLSLSVFVEAWAFSHEHQFRVGVAHSEHHLRAAAAKAALRAVAQGVGQRAERLRRPVGARCGYVLVHVFQSIRWSADGWTGGCLQAEPVARKQGGCYATGA